MVLRKGGRRKREGASEAPVVRPSRARVLEFARAKVSVKGLALGLKGKVGNDVVKPSERSKVWQWASAILGLCNGRVSVKGLASGLKGKVANDVVKPSKGSKAWHWDEYAGSDTCLAPVIWQGKTWRGWS